MQYAKSLVLLIILLGISSAPIDLLALQANIYQNGTPLDSGNVSVLIYDSASGGSLIWNQTYTNNITNGTYDLLLGSTNSNNLSLNFGTIYYLDIQINSLDQNFSGSDRQQFQSSVGNITSSKIVQNAINETHIAASSITTSKIATGAISATHISANVINSTHISPGNITADKIGTSAVNTTHIQDGTIRANDLASLIINGSHIDTSANLSLGWGNVTTYPSACSAGQYVSGVGFTLTCSNPSNNINASNITTGILSTQSGGTGSNLTGFGTGAILYSTSGTAFSTLAGGGANDLLFLMYNNSATSPRWVNVTTASGIYDSTGLRMNDVSTNDWGSSSGYLVIGDDGVSSCSSVCSSHGISSCTIAYNLTGGSLGGCSGNGGVKKYCWCG